MERVEARLLVPAATEVRSSPISLSVQVLSSLCFLFRFLLGFRNCLFERPPTSRRCVLSPVFFLLFSVSLPLIFAHLLKQLLLTNAHSESWFHYHSTLKRARVRHTAMSTLTCYVDRQLLVPPVLPKCHEVSLDAVCTQV